MNLYKEIVSRNEVALETSKEKVDSVILSMKNTAFILSTKQGVKYLATKTNASQAVSDYEDEVQLSMSLLKNSTQYIEEIYLYFNSTQKIITTNEVFSVENYDDPKWLIRHLEELKKKPIVHTRVKYGKYPYLITLLCPLNIDGNWKYVTFMVDINAEKLGKYIGNGSYENTDYSPMLLILDENRENIIYSEEYRLLKEGIGSLYELEEQIDWTGSFSQECSIWGENYIISGLQNEEDGFWYLYLSSINQFESQKQESDRVLANVIVIECLVCLALAFFLAVWVYKPVGHTISMLDDVYMLAQWDQKEHLDEMEAIRRSILAAKKVQDDMEECMRERMVSLHNAQMCALQTQINPHFLYNTLETIGNGAALLNGLDNAVTKAIYTLGCLMRISLAGENYLVPVVEELEHVKLYVELLEFRFRGRIRLYVDIPDDLCQEKIVKLTLQPLIENAIDHGFSNRRNQGNIWIRGERDGDRIVIHVIDDGEGISVEREEELRKMLESSALTEERHIGLRNVNQRLKLIFGEDGGLQIKQRPEGGMWIMVCFKSLRV